jgi:hypothetical protein
LAAANAKSMQLWRKWLEEWITQADDEGAIRSGLQVPVAAQTLLSFLLGAQISACLDSQAQDADGLQVQAESLVDSWRTRQRHESETLPV